MHLNITCLKRAILETTVWMRSIRKKGFWTGCHRLCPTWRLKIYTQTSTYRKALKAIRIQIKVLSKSFKIPLSNLISSKVELKSIVRSSHKINLRTLLEAPDRTRVTSERNLSKCNPFYLFKFRTWLLRRLTNTRGTESIFLLNLSINQALITTTYKIHW